MKFIIGIILAVIAFALMKYFNIHDFLNGYWCASTYFITVHFYDKIKL